MARTIRHPALDLRPLLHFRPDSVWLGENRMVLMHSLALGGLRNELIRALGPVRARGVLLRVGFTAGRCDAAMLRRQAPERPVAELIQLGPTLHGMEGLVRARITRAEVDEPRGRFHAEGVWENSWEDEQHSPGLSGDGPACWNQIGYVSGFCSGLMGRLIVAREHQCMSQGDAHCTLTIQDAESCGDAQYLRHFHEQELDAVVAPLGAPLELDVAEQRAAHSLPQAGDALIGESRPFRAALDLLARAAGARITVLLLGETGVGKERFARWLHEHGPRADQPFVAVNCAAIPGELIESELFGVERGAYTGAQQPRAGRFERAHGGTLFLDEVGDLAPQAQAKLLRVLQSGEVERLGAQGARRVDVRVVAATHVDLMEAVRDKRFRADLYYRLSPFPIVIPPLRERRGDIVPLAEAFLARCAQAAGKSFIGLSERARITLRHHDWPGNVRELENVIERAVLLAPAGATIERAHLPDALGGDAPEQALDAQGHVRGADHDALTRLLDAPLDLDALLATLMRGAVEKSGGNLAEAARRLGISRAQLAYRLRQLSI